MLKAAIVTAGVFVAGIATAADLLLPRPGGGYERQTIPDTRSDDRVDVRPVPGTNSAGVYDRAGRRVGTVESKPYGGAVLYDNAGRRR